MKKSFVNAYNSKRGGEEGYKRIIDTIEKDGVCPFCPEHLLKYHKNPILEDGVYWLLTDNMYSYQGAKHQLLLIHKKHIESVLDLSEKAWGELFRLVRSETTKRGIRGGTLYIRFGDSSYTGASVAHLHANVISPDLENKNREPIMARVG